MKISNEGKLQDSQLDEGKLIISTIYDILQLEWYPLMREEFKNHQMDTFAVIIFSGLLICNDPSKEELTDILFNKEIEKLRFASSYLRCKSLADNIFSLMPWINLNKIRTDDPGFPPWSL